MYYADIVCICTLQQGVRQEKVADKHGKMVVPGAVDGHGTPAGHRIVNQIVVDERCVVEQFHGGGSGEHIVVHLPEQARAQKHEYGADLLPFLFEIVMHHPVHKHIGRIERRQYTVVEALQIGSQSLLNSLKRGHYF